MARRGTWGHVINICCLEGHSVGEAGEGNAFYAATKHALRAMTEGLRQEVRCRAASRNLCSVGGSHTCVVEGTPFCAPCASLGCLLLPH